MVEELLSEELSSTITMRVGSLLTRRALRHFRRRVDYSEYGGAPLLGVAGVTIVGHGRSSAKAVRNAWRMAYRFASEPLHRARRAGDRGRARCPHHVIAFIFPGQGSQKVGMGKALADAFPICRETFAEADAALGEPLSRLCFEGPEDQLTLTENTQPAILAVSIAAYRLLAVDGHRSRPSSPATASASTRPTSPPARSRSPMRCASCAAAAATCRRPCRSATGAMAAILGLDARRGRAGVRRGGAGRGRQPGEPERRRPGRDCRLARRGRARGRAREGARREARDPAAGQRAVPLRADEAGRGAARAGAARAREPRDPRVPIVANVDAEPKRDGVGRHRGARRAGVVAGPLGGGRAAPCVGRRHNVC